MTQNHECNLGALLPSDIAQASALCCGCLPGEPRTPSMLEESLHNPYHLLLAAKKQQIVCGLLEAVLVSDDCSLLLLAVLPEFRRKGVGTALLQRLVDFARSKNARGISLEVRSSNLPAQKLYESAGFQRAGIRPGFYSAPKEDAIVLIRPL